MSAKKQTKYGNIYEILLPNCRYAYVCWIERYGFGIFDYISEKQTDLEYLLSVGFKTYKAGKETAIKKKIWKLIGHIDLEKENIQFPDLVIFLAYNKEQFIERSRIMRNGNPLIVPKEYYLNLLKQARIYGFFDNHKSFELWLSFRLENYPESEEIFPLPRMYG
jgi:hypothetical protein